MKLRTIVSGSLSLVAAWTSLSACSSGDAVDPYVDTGGGGTDGGGDGGGSGLPVGAQCTTDDQCSGPQPGCTTGAYPLASDPPPCSVAITQLGADFPGGYCTRKSPCHVDGDCGTGGKCFIPLGDTPATTIKELADGVTCPTIKTFGTDGFCLKPCSDVGECRGGYICDIPFGGLISGIKGARIDQKYCIGDPAAKCKLCDKNATCDPSVGVCTCNPGFSGDGKKCTAGGCTPTCGANATCGADSKCTCNTGFFGDPIAGCAKSTADCGAPPTVTNATAPTVSGGSGGGTTTTAGATAAYTCNSGFTKSGGDPTCGADGKWTTPTPTCVPVGSSCGTFTDVVYRTTGTFAITKTPLGAGDQSFSGLTANSSSPKFTGSGDTTPFSIPAPSGGATFTGGFARLRFTNDGGGKPIAGTVRLVEWFFPLEFTQTKGATLTANVDHSVGLLATGLANCGGGDAACSAHAPTISRPCASNATGTLAGTTLTWGSCTPTPTLATSWSYASARAATGAGCASGYSGWGNVTCTSGCSFVPASGVGDSFQTWNQAMSTFTFSGTDMTTATFTMPTMEIPNGTGSSVTLLSITSTTVLKTQCGSTPGTDLVCNVQ